eukprot:gene7203-8366_t
MTRNLALVSKRLLRLTAQVQQYKLRTPTTAGVNKIRNRGLNLATASDGLRLLVVDGAEAVRNIAPWDLFETVDKLVIYKGFGSLDYCKRLVKNVPKLPLWYLDLDLHIETSTDLVKALAPVSRHLRTLCVEFVTSGEEEEEEVDNIVDHTIRNLVLPNLLTLNKLYIYFEPLTAQSAKLLNKIIASVSTSTSLTKIAFNSLASLPSQSMLTELASITSLRSVIRLKERTKGTFQFSRPEELDKYAELKGSIANFGAMDIQVNRSTISRISTLDHRELILRPPSTASEVEAMQESWNPAINIELHPRVVNLKLTKWDNDMIANFANIISGLHTNRSVKRLFVHGTFETEDTLLPIADLANLLRYNPTIRMLTISKVNGPINCFVPLYHALANYNRTLLHIYIRNSNHGPGEMNALEHCLSVNPIIQSVQLPAYEEDQTIVEYPFTLLQGIFTVYHDQLYSVLHLNRIPIKEVSNKNPSINY